MVLMFSMDGAQLYRNKVSECWMYIWIIFDRSPDQRYKKRYVLPGGFIGGPNAPHYPDTFLYTGLYLLAAIMRDEKGLPVWDSRTARDGDPDPDNNNNNNNDDEELLKYIRLFLAIAGADTVGMADLNGGAGHTAKMLCRLFCPIIGRRKTAKGTHYPCCARPDHYHIVGCDHPDVDIAQLLADFTSESAAKRYDENLIRVASSSSLAAYKRNRRETGISKPTIFSGLPSRYTFGIPDIFALDYMHPIINLKELIIPLWIGQFQCDPTDDRRTWFWVTLTGDTWTSHGQWVEDLAQYLPGSFDTAPRNPAAKLNTGYKCWEFLIYFVCYGPAVFYGIVDDDCYRNYCQLIRAIRILLQREITVEENREAAWLLKEFSEGYERLYVQRRADRLHFVRPVIHFLMHWAEQTRRKGPGNIYAQWVLETLIGNLGAEIKQHSNPYANLAHRGIRRAQTNALKSLIPDLAPEKGLPSTAKPLGDGYALLQPADRCYRPVSDEEYAAVERYIRDVVGSEDEDEAVEEWDGKVWRQGRVLLPNGQIVRSAWAEQRNGNEFHRTNRMVKVFNETRGVESDVDGESEHDSELKIEFAEVRYFAKLRIQRIEHVVAIGAFFGPPDEHLLDISSGTYYSVQHSGDDDIRVFNIKTIQSVVMMGPDRQYQLYRDDDSAEDRYFMVEKPGLKMAELIEVTELDDELDDNGDS
ncbi:hypothetical protein HMN09_00208100 [Mycena chlorophos]|uniref:Uncharacterized protein n=1 Tax=Mycena chlorophos TaxID=658473 RepID=A0A8H6WL79_MYCCL|nr:hypothetical protein HMN09_00208100 [Mycena chlorophos]